MSRPRSTDPSVPLSIAVPSSLKTRLDQELAYTSSRSQWVVHAIKEKLNQQFDYDSLSTRFLIRELQFRNIISNDLLTSLMMRVGEIEEGQ